METPDTDPDLARLRRLAHRMDNAFRLPVIGTRVGWDSILGLVPVVGDALALAPALYILKAAHGKGAPVGTLGLMGLNIGIDTAIGAIPILGDIFDIGWKANTRNVDILHRHLAQRAENEKGQPEGRPQT